jgi:hypothetical protein
LFIETEHALMKDNKLNTKYGISMTKITRKLKALKKKISERHTDKPEENEPAVEKRIRKKTVRT